VRGEVPPAIRRSVELWVGCVAGALSDSDYLAKLAAAGFECADIEVTRVYSIDDAQDFLAGQGADIKQLAQQVDGKFVSGFIRAVKPATAVRSSAGEVPRVAGSPSQASSCCASSRCGCGS